ncbi:MAG: hypothetical protein KatS3mg033_1494 [Thermonema sp.]|nr:MAG: hypothetical protein KatS3mg033_1494 [Thermonema sp.]
MIQFMSMQIYKNLDCMQCLLSANLKVFYDKVSFVC